MVSLTRSPPSSPSNGFVREVPRIVPPCFAMPWMSRRSRRDHVAVDHPAPAIAEPHEVALVDLDALQHGAADDRIQPGAVAAAGEDPDGHESIMSHRCTSLAPGISTLECGGQATLLSLRPRNDRFHPGSTQAVRLACHSAPGVDYRGKTLGIVGLVVAIIANLIGLIISVIAYNQSKAAGYKNTPAFIGIIVGAVLLVLEHHLRHHLRRGARRDLRE